jgi:hypothetical protein
MLRKSNPVSYEWLSLCDPSYFIAANLRYRNILNILTAFNTILLPEIVLRPSQSF